MSDRSLKLLLDRIGASLALVLLAPLCVLLALLVVCDGRPVLHREQRMGRNGRPFTILKFRTLRAGSASTPSVAADDDPRITPVGRRLRRWRLDEIPQLWNVLRGEMSLVGPRPMPALHVARIPQAERTRLLSVAPGITGPAAIEYFAEDRVLAGRSNAEALYLAYLLPARTALQLDYLAHWSLRRDLAILLATALRLWSRSGRARSAARVLKLLPSESGSEPPND